MKAGSAAKLIVDALLQRFLPLARRRIETARVQDPGSFENGFSGTDEKIFAPQTSFKARSGPLQFVTGLGFGAGFTPPGQANATESGLSPKELHA